jgi:hypothetical protein
MGEKGGESSKDRLADALAAMSGGQAAPIPSNADDENLAAPAPDQSVFAPRHRTADLLAEQRLRTQRTAIPILLTCGLLLPAIGTLKWLAPADSVFAQWDLFMPLGLGAVGALLVAAAVINMLHVRDALRGQQGRSAAGGLTRRGAGS